jgi:hypothetical protein
VIVWTEHTQLASYPVSQGGSKIAQQGTPAVAQQSKKKISNQQ